MFSLIVAIISVVLVVALVAATVYWGGSSITGNGPRVTAEVLINQANHILGAAVLYDTEHGDAWPATPQTVGAEPYLDEMPVPPQAAYAASAGVVSANDWTWYAPGTHHLTIKGKIDKAVCQAIDSMYGMTAIPSDLDPNHIIQCYGPAEPYTFFVDPASSTMSDRIAIIGPTVPPGGGSVSVNNDSSVSTTPPGTPAGGNNSTQIAGPLPGSPPPQSPLPAIVTNAPFITPAKWTQGGTAPAEPTPPSSFPEVVLNYSGTAYTAPSGGQTFPVPASPDAPTFCDKAWALVSSYWSNFNASSRFYTQNSSSPYTIICGIKDYSGNGFGYGQGGANMGCPAGYNLYGGNCYLQNASLVQLPSDGKCEMTASSSGTLVPNSKDPDCAKVSTSQPVASNGSVIGTAVWGNQTFIGYGTQGVLLRYNPDGSVRTKHCDVAYLAACFAQ